MGFAYDIQVLKITVAALMTPPWVAARITPSKQATCILLPGYCEGDLTPLQQATGLPVIRGPRDLRRLYELFDPQLATDTGYGPYDIQILAEINHAPQLALAQILAQARQLQAAGADVIDVGCNPGQTWKGVGQTVRALREAGHRVSIDSLQVDEIAAAVQAGAELVLSVNSQNRHAAPDWGCEVVAIPDDPQTLAGLEETVDHLAQAGVPLRIDPVLSPIGFGFADSLHRYLETRQRYPDAEMMMGIGNLTELTDVDSAGVNVILLGLCQELGIRSVLTTQVINWARTAVRECDLARRLVYHAVRHGLLPKHVEPRLVMLRDPQVPQYGEEQLDQLSGRIRDNNFRIFAEGEQLHLICAGVHLTGTDPFAMFEQLLGEQGEKLDRGHAFYLGFELAKALTALTLGKDYRQDEALNWGFLTRSEGHHHRIRE
ncbi:MAG: dihydropteroate synthase [Planctomycetales bacterium]|nr:dihydropteroate synthase [Planctomycetales bacterium]